jgi:hypothetical protein
MRLCQGCLRALLHPTPKAHLAGEHAAGEVGRELEHRAGKRYARARNAFVTKGFSTAPGLFRLGIGVGSRHRDLGLGQVPARDVDPTWFVGISLLSPFGLPAEGTDIINESVAEVSESLERSSE